MPLNERRVTYRTVSTVRQFRDDIRFEMVALSHG